MAFTVNENTIIGDILDHDADVAPFFLDMGMHCLGCPASRAETLAEACQVHGVDVKGMMDKINSHLTNK